MQETDELQISCMSNAERCLCLLEEEEDVLDGGALPRWLQKVHPPSPQCGPRHRCVSHIVATVSARSDRSVGDLYRDVGGKIRRTTTAEIGLEAEGLSGPRNERAREKNSDIGG